MVCNCATSVPVTNFSSTDRRQLCIYIDNDLTMQTHVKRTVSRRFASLRRLRQIRHLVPTATLQMLVGRFGPLPTGLLRK